MKSLANQVMLLTGAGGSAIATVRLVGPGVDAFLQKRFSQPVPMGRCVHGLLRDGEQIIDDPVIVRVSIHVIDINLHGGTWVIKSVIELAKLDGFELIDASKLPLPKMAVDGSSQIWGEVLTHLPQARTELAARMLLAQPVAWSTLERRIATGQISEAQLQMIRDDPGAKWMLTLPMVAIIGPANVGKSTLANQLFAQERSITANLPGTTRDWVGEIANIDGLAVMLVDTPGVRDTEDAIEHAAIAAAIERSQSAHLVLIVLDQSEKLGEGERALIERYPDAIIIANKSDVSPAWDAVILDAIRTMATLGQGIDAVRSAILRHFGCYLLDLQQPRCWTAQQRERI